MKHRTKRRPAKHSRPTGPTTPQSLLTEPMVDRLFSRTTAARTTTTSLSSTPQATSRG